MKSIFTVTKEDLDRLNPEEAVTFFHSLLYAEASTNGIQIDKCSVPLAVNVRDGGVDAQVEGAPLETPQGLIKEGLTSYQIKTGDFSITQKAKIDEILFKERKKDDPYILKPRVQECLDKDGTFIIVLFGWDNPEKTDDQIKDSIIGTLTTQVDEKYKDAKVAVWQQNHLLNFIKPYPSLALQVNNRDKCQFLTHNIWSNCAEMRRHFEPGEEQLERIDDIRSNLIDKELTTHMRILGEPGIGKTRLVLEATRTKALMSLVIYCDKPRKFLDSILMNELLKEDSNFSVILIVDECDRENRARIWDQLRYRGPKIKLVTIFNEEENDSEMNYIRVEKLSDDKISSIIQSYGTKSDIADRWANLCEGYPRVAHLVGINLQSNSDDLLKEPSTSLVWDRFICGHDSVDSPEVKERRLVLQCLSLYKKFGFDVSLKHEINFILGKIQEIEPGITFGRFESIINQLKDRKILQGEYTLYLTPKLLHIKLWVDWWEERSRFFVFDEFKREMPPRLLDWFYDMFIYTRESRAASGIVDRLLAEGGPFCKDDFLSDGRATSFFLTLAKVNPGAALKVLNKTIGFWSRDQLLKFSAGRRDIIRALEYIVMFKEFFAEAARLILKLGEAENETWSNNASGVFSSLFSPAYGRVAPTQASPQERLPVLEEALTSTSSEIKDLALKACASALRTNSFSRMAGDILTGLRTPPEGWMPKTYSDIFDSYEMVWGLLSETIPTLSFDEQERASKILVGHAAGIARIKRLTQMVTETLEDLSTKSYGDREAILETIIRHLRKDVKLPESMKSSWKALRVKLEGEGPSSMMQRYVGMNIFADRFNDKGEQEDQTIVKIEELVELVMKDKKLLLDELYWLVTNKAKNGYQFGYFLSKKDLSFEFLDVLLDAQRGATEDESVFFLGGYFKGLNEKDIVKWDELLESLVKDNKLNKHIPELTWRSGMTDDAALRVLNIVKNKIASTDSLGMFAFGSTTKNISSDVFNEWIYFLIGENKFHALSAALTLCSYYYIHDKKEEMMPKEMACKLVLNREFFVTEENINQNNTLDYAWGEIAKKLIKDYPEAKEDVVDIIVEYFGEEKGIFNCYHSVLGEVLRDIMKLTPWEIWTKVSMSIVNGKSTGAFWLRDWFQENNLLELLPLEKLWIWIEEDIDNRLEIIVSLVPNSLNINGKLVNITYELLKKYGNKEDVRNNVRSNFWTGVWTGPSSLRYKNQRKEMMKMKKDETDKNVLKFLDEYIETLSQSIEEEKKHEERRL